MKPELLLKINGFVTKYEYHLLAFLLASLLLNHFSDYEFRSTLLILVTSTLAWAYIFTSFDEVNNVNISELDSKLYFLIPFSKKLTAISSGISCIAILFIALKWPGGINLFIIGISTLVACVITLLYLKSKIKKLISQSILVRALVLVITLGYVWYFNPSPPISL